MLKTNKSLLISIFIMYYFLFRGLLFNHNNNEFQFRSNYLFSYGYDGINMGLIILTTIIFPIILLIREKYNNEDSSQFNFLILLTEILLLLFFLSLDLFIFYTLFELVLIPLFLLII